MTARETTLVVTPGGHVAADPDDPAAAVAVTRAGYAVCTHGGPARLRHPGCGATFPAAAWWLQASACAEVEAGVFVPCRSCPNCGSHMAASSLEAA